MTPSQTIPVLSLKDFLEGTPSEQVRFVTSLGSALRDIGFFALSDHGVSQPVIRESYEQAQKFFNLQEKEKLAYQVSELKGQRGYTSFGKEHAKDSKAPDLKEFWHVGREQGSDSDHLHNIWPSELPEFRPTMTKLFSDLETCSMHLLDACSLYLDLPRGYLREAATGGNSVLRVIHYPPVPKERDPASIRAAAHEDINLITLLCESTAAGLELLQRDGSWLPVHSLAGQIIVDSGDMLQNLTNGLLRSTTHRVVNPDNSRERRFSMPFFVHPRSEFSLAPLKQTLGEFNRRYPSITAGEYLHQRLREIGLG